MNIQILYAIKIIWNLTQLKPQTQGLYGFPTYIIKLQDVTEHSSYRQKKKKKEQQTDVGVNVVCTDYNSCVTLGKETFKFQDPHLWHGLNNNTVSKWLWK